MSGGKKFDQDKPDLSLLSSKALVEISRVMTFGKNKYGAQNWRKGIEWSRVFAAVQRHLLAWNDGETNDPETGISHLAHAGCGIMFLLEFAKSHPELDNRHKEVNNGKEKPITEKELAALLSTVQLAPTAKAAPSSSVPGLRMAPSFVDSARLSEMPLPKRGND